MLEPSIMPDCKLQYYMLFEVNHDDNDYTKCIYSFFAKYGEVNLIYPTHDQKCYCFFNDEDSYKKCESEFKIQNNNLSLYSGVLLKVAEKEQVC